MFLSLAKTVDSKESACTQMTQKLEDVYQYLSENKLPITGQLIKNIQESEQAIFPKLTKENEQEIL